MLGLKLAREASSSTEGIMSGSEDHREESHTHLSLPGVVMR